MERKVIDFYKVQKRKTLLQESKENVQDSRYLYDNLLESLKENKSTLKSDVDAFFKSCNNSYNANKYYKQCINVLEQLECKNVELVDSTSTFFVDMIVPYIDPLYLLKDCVDESVLYISKDKILYSIKEFKICDRVINNSNSISKRYDLDTVIQEKRNFPLFESVFNFCELLDTYEIPEYGKMNIALEQLSYYLQKNSINYNREDLSSYVTEYFLLSNSSLSDSDIKRFKFVLEENMFLEDDDIRYNPIRREELEKEEQVNSNTITYTQDNISAIISSFKIAQEKTIDLLQNTFDRIFSNEKYYIVKNYSYILQFIRNMMLIGTFEKEELIKALDYCIERIKALELEANELDSIILQLQVELNIMDKICIRSEDKESFEKIRDYCEKISNDLEDIINIRSSLYSQEKIDADIKFQTYKESLEPQSIHEFKIFKFQNIINGIIHADRFLERKGNKLVDFIKNKSKKVFANTKRFFTESGDINPELIAEDNNIDICLYVYEVAESTDIVEMHKVMESLCNYLNSTCKYNESSRFTYRSVNSIFELHLEDATFILMDDYSIIENYMSEFDMCNCGYIIESSNIWEELSNILLNKDTILDECVYSIYNNQDIERILYSIEAMKYAGIFSKKNALDVVKCYNEAHIQDFVSNTRLNTLLESWSSTVFDSRNINLYTEGMEAVNMCLDESVNLNMIKLKMEGLKKKVRMLSAKEQNMARNLDATMNHFMNSMKNALTTDRREAIIKGSVIPSFSRCIKVAISLAGIARFVDPVLAVITAFVGLAVSKNLTRKERSLLLDEIDIELKVLDKEISIAENNNNMKKYRELVTYQKKLQREKQRIKYNIKIGKDLPDSNIGTAYKNE